MIAGLLLLALLVALTHLVNRLGADEPLRGPDRPVLTWY
jgi:hypothetical protein